MFVTDADREAARALREKLAEISGFWHKMGDDTVLCVALAQHRLEAEKRLAEKLATAMTADGSDDQELDFGRPLRPSSRPRGTSASH